MIHNDWGTQKMLNGSHKTGQSNVYSMRDGLSRDMLASSQCNLFSFVKLMDFSYIFMSLRLSFYIVGNICSR